MKEFKSDSNVEKRDDDDEQIKERKGGGRKMRRRKKSKDKGDNDQKKIGNGGWWEEKKGKKSNFDFAADENESHDKGDDNYTKGNMKKEANNKSKNSCVRIHTM
ncbi:hypothetical protein M0R45_024608 [Rubus argutus]|uniref:Uncharacterized protein n=1 Tax=Rubus argutus TaxID=59490 RepID=A0AAW1WRJ6_RUBAR